MRIGLFGGTFDPPHNGHLAVARRVLDSRFVDEVWFLPCWQHAFGKAPSPFTARVEMCRILVERELGMKVCDMEGQIKSTYSIEILTAIKQAFPSHDFRLVLGSDNYWKMDGWKEKDKVLELAPPIWVRRPDAKEIPEPYIYCDSSESSTDIRRLFAMLPREILRYLIDRPTLYKNR
jgi:nicotinate-nucleotide adenylyltransferase